MCFLMVLSQKYGGNLPRVGGGGGYFILLFWGEIHTACTQYDIYDPVIVFF